jgi:hypothetical protein
VSKQSRRARPGNRPARQAAPASLAGTRPSDQATAAAGSAPDVRPAGTPSTRPASTRAGRRERARPATGKPFFERYRIAIVGVVGVAAVALLAVWAFNSASAAAFQCSTEWVPDPTPTPADGASPQPGFHQEPMGATHVGPGTSQPGEVTYTYCPPASGSHFQRGGPISPGFYGPGDIPLPQGWIHNLEHGGLVVLYRGRDGDPGLSGETQQQMEAFFSGMPPSPVCQFPPTQDGAGVTIVRFDDMATPFAAMVWERVLPLETFDEDAIMEFWTTFGERTNPEQFCQPPSPSPSTPAASPAPS